MVLIIPYSHYYWVGGPPKFYVFVGAGAGKDVLILSWVI